MSTGSRKTINPNNLCLNCMKELPGISMCAYCGWQKGTPPKEPYQLMPGILLNERYVIGTVVGFGGFGITYTAWDMSLKQKVAIKEYYPAGTVNRIPRTAEVNVHNKYKKRFEHGLKRYIDEARSLAMFADHPGIVSVYNYFSENNTAYIVMEFLEGMSLKEYLDSCDNKLPYKRAISIIRPLFDALSEVHTKKIIHRDLSPDNVYITTNGNVKLIDFGAARLNDGEELETSEVILKPGYAPPEQYRSKGKHGEQTDIYALAAMLYQMLTGELPPESVNRVIADEMKPISEFEVEEDIPIDIINAVHRGLAIERTIRFKTIRDFEAAIEMTKISEPPEIVRKKRKFRTRIAISVGIFFVAGIIAFIPIWNTYLHPEDVLTGGEIHGANISILITDEDANMYNQLIQEFEKEYPLITVNLFSVVKEKYEEELLNREKQRNLPTIYLSDLISFDNQPKNMKLDRLYENMPIDLKYDYIDMMNYEGSDWISVSIDFPVMYYNNDFLDEIDFDIQKLTDTDNFETITKGLLEEDILAITLGISDDCENMLKELNDNNLESILNISNKELSITDFINESVAIFIDKTSNSSILKQQMSGYLGATVYPMIDDENLPGEFTAKLSITKKASRYEEDAALLFLNFLMADYAQNLMTIQYNEGYPLNDALSDEFFKSHNDLEEFEELVEKLIVFR